eukprot:2155858-Pleurochrysis_carterae.AAC.8
MSIEAQDAAEVAKAERGAATSPDTSDSKCDPIRPYSLWKNYHLDIVDGYCDEERVEARLEAETKHTPNAASSTRPLNAHSRTATRTNWSTSVARSVVSSSTLSTWPHEARILLPSASMRSTAMLTLWHSPAPARARAWPSLFVQRAPQPPVAHGTRLVRGVTLTECGDIDGTWTPITAL